MERPSRPNNGAIVILAIAVSLLASGSGHAAAVDPSGAQLALEDRVAALEGVVDEQRELLEAMGQADYTRVISEIASERSNVNPSRGWLGNLAYGVSTTEVDVHGFINLEYIDAGKDGSRGGTRTFDNHHANLFLDAVINPKLRAHVELEFEHGGTTIEVDQAYFSYGVFDWMTVGGGRFYAPFGIERFVWYAPVNKLVSRPLPFRQIVPGNFYAEGLNVSGNVGWTDDVRFTYEAAVTNGLGDVADTDRRGSRVSRDNNDDMAVTARVATILWPWAEIGASIHSQRYTDDGEKHDGLLLVGFDASARWRGFEVRSEYVMARLDRDRSGMDHLDQNGWYTQLSYTQDLDYEHATSVVLVTRVDNTNLDDDVSGNDDIYRWSLGANLTITDHFHLKGEYQLTRERGPHKDDNAFLGALVVDF